MAVESVRIAAADDLAAMIALVNEFVEEQRPLRGGEVWAAFEANRTTPEAVAAALRQSQTAGSPYVCLLGCLDDVVVGVAIVTIDDVEPVGRLAMIRTLYVQPEGREVGVGSALLERIVDIAASRGCVGVDATVLPGSRGAKNFFEMHGLVARAISVHRPVTPRS